MLQARDTTMPSAARRASASGQNVGYRIKSSLIVWRFRPDAIEADQIDWHEGTTAANATLLDG